jgi:hypothetical protein
MEMIGMDMTEIERMKDSARSDFFDKAEAQSLVNRSKIIDRYDYEANKHGSIVIDYDKYRRAYIEQAMLMIGAIGLYFMIGLIYGVAIVLG